MRWDRIDWRIGERGGMGKRRGEGMKKRGKK